MACGLWLKNLHHVGWSSVSLSDSFLLHLWLVSVHMYEIISMCDVCILQCAPNMIIMGPGPLLTYPKAETSLETIPKVLEKERASRCERQHQPERASIFVILGSYWECIVRSDLAKEKNDLVTLLRMFLCWHCFMPWHFFVWCPIYSFFFSFFSDRLASAKQPRGGRITF